MTAEVVDWKDTPIDATCLELQQTLIKFENPEKKYSSSLKPFVGQKKYSAPLLPSSSHEKKPAVPLNPACFFWGGGSFGWLSPHKLV